MGDYATVRQWCLAQPGAVEDFPFGPEPAVFRVGGKLFALLSGRDDAARLSLKCEPATAEALRASYPAVTPGYHLNKRHWNTVALDGTIPDPLLIAWIEDSYDLVVAGLPKAVRAALAAETESGAAEPGN